MYSKCLNPSIAAWLAIAAIFSSATSVHAIPLSMEASDVLDGEAGAAMVETDGNGTWLSVYANEGDIKVSRSTDNAQSWSVSQIVYDGFSQTADLAGDGLGNWMIVWSNARWYGEGSEVMFSRSNDNGATWSSAALIDPAALVDGENDYSAAVAAGSSGRWIVVWQRDIYEEATVVSSATDNLGLTWTMPQTIASAFLLNSLAIATDGAGVWIASWAEGTEHLIDGNGIGESHSSDNGATWSLARKIDTNIDPGGRGSVSVATDRSGTWLLAYEQQLDSQSRDQEIYAVRSQDAGASWSAPMEIDANASQSVGSAKSTVRLVYDSSDSTWVAFWASDQAPFGVIEDYEILYARSTDAGASWSLPAMANPEGDADGPHYFTGFDAATDGAGTWSLVYSRYTRENFYNVYFTDMRRAVSFPDCSAVPLPGCNATAAANRSSLKIFNQVGGKDIVQWQWSRGAPTDLSEFGDPTTSTGYVLCLYDYVADMPRLVFEKDVAAARTCGETPCWEAVSDGFEYSDPKHSLTSVGRVDLSSNDTGRAKLRFKASGAAVAPPVLPLAMNPRALVQLVNEETGGCWEASFTEATRNDERVLKTRSSAP